MIAAAKTLENTPASATHDGAASEISIPAAPSARIRESTTGAARPFRAARRFRAPLGRGIAGVVAAASLLLAACGQKSAAPAARPATEVGVVSVTTEPVALKSELAGRTAASLVSDVRPQVSGIVKARKFEEGSRVEAGQVLYEIDPATYQSAYDQAKADLTNAEAAVAAAKLKDERYAELLQIEGVSKQDADDARTGYQQTLAAVALKKAALETSRINLGYTKVRAPISGRIGKSTVTAGALVTANQETALATIRALDPIYVDLTQSSSQLLRLRKLLGSQGMQSGSTQVHLKLEDGSDYATPGTLQFQEVAVDEATGSVTLRAQFPNKDGVLLPGMYVRAMLDEAVNTAAILAPQQAVTRDPRGNALAMVVDSENKVVQRELVADRAIGDRWLITEGLAAGDRLIVEGLNKIRAGQTVRPVVLNAANSSGPSKPVGAPLTARSAKAPGAEAHSGVGASDSAGGM